MSESDAIARATTPATVDTLARDLRALGLAEGQTVLVHTSLSALGYVITGPVTLLLALEEVLGPTGTLMMPTHSSDLSDPAAWVSPPVPFEWIEIIRTEMPAFDPHLTPTRGMGRIESRAQLFCNGKRFLYGEWTGPLQPPGQSLSFQ